jgi:hypothetical protein
VIRAPNPVPESKKSRLYEAAERFERFTGHDATYYDEVQVSFPDVAFNVGKIDGIMYETKREGKTEHYCHKFKSSARPVFAVSHDGKQLLAIGGKFRFTDRGIVDTD